MKNTSTVGNALRALALGALVMAGVGASAGTARADLCFGGGGGGPSEPKDAGDSDGSTLGLQRGFGARRTTGAGLVLVAGLGGAWLGTRRKKDDGAGDDRDAPLK